MKHPKKKDTFSEFLDTIKKEEYFQKKVRIHSRKFFQSRIENDRKMKIP